MLFEIENQLQRFIRFSKLSNLLLNSCKLSTYPEIIMETSTPIIYHSLNDIKNAFNKDEFNNLTPVKKLLTIYNDAYAKFGHLIKRKEEKKYPLVVFEGLDGSGKTTISRKTAAKYNATLLITPPNCIRELRPFFDDHELRTPYYCLGNYIAELEVLNGLETGPVVLDRFWHSTASFAIAQCIENGQIPHLPPKNDNIYAWPLDILKPDLVVLLSVSEHIRQSRHSRRNTTNTTQEQLLKTSTGFRTNVINAYENMYDPKIVHINGDGSIGQTLALVSEKITNLL